MLCPECNCDPTINSKDVWCIKRKDGRSGVDGGGVVTPCTLEALLDSQEAEKPECTHLCLSSCGLASISLPPTSRWAPLFARLTTLDLSDNVITEIPDDFFERIPHVTLCSFANNRISSVPPTISKLHRAEIISFKNNLLRETSVPFNVILALGSLRSFNISKNYINTSLLVSSPSSFSIPPPYFRMMPYFVSIVCFGGWNQCTPSPITEHLYLGSLESTADPAELRRLGITHILSVGLAPLCSEGFATLRIAVADYPSEPLVEHFDEAVAFIDSAVQAGNGCLVHCAAGQSRSVSCVCAWLIKRRGMSADEALAFVKKARRCASPNLGFVEQLQVYSKGIAN